MRAAFLVTAAYEGSSQIPSLPSSALAASVVEKRCSEPDCAFETRRLAAERHLPLKLTESLAQLAPGSTLLVYFGGYVTVSEDRGSALLLEGERLKALKWGKVRSLLQAARMRTLVIVDAIAMPGAQPSLDQTCESIGASLVDSSEMVSAIVVVRPSPASDPAPFAHLFVAVSEYLSMRGNPDTEVTERALFDAMRQERACFWRLGRAGLYTGRGEFPLLKARGPNADTQHVPTRYGEEAESRFIAPPRTTDSVLPAVPMARPRPEPQPSPEATWESPRDSLDEVGSRDSELDVPTPRRPVALEERELCRTAGASAANTPLEMESREPMDAFPWTTSAGTGAPSRVGSASSDSEDVGSDSAATSNPFAVLRDSWSEARHEDSDSDASSGPISEPSSNLRNREQLPAETARPLSVPRPPPSPPQPRSAPPPRIGSSRPPADAATLAHEPAPDSIPPSIPSAAWSGLYHPELDPDEGFYASPLSSEEGGHHNDSDVSGMDAEQLLRAAARRPVAPPSESDVPPAASSADSALNLRASSPSVPSPPQGSISPPPPPGAVRRSLAPPPSRVRTSSIVPPVQASRAAEEGAPISSRELQAAVLAHLDSAQRRAAAGDLDTAVEHLKRALLLGVPDVATQAEIRCRLANLYVVQDRSAEALAELERATQLAPEHPTARAQLTELLQESGRHARLPELGEPPTEAAGLRPPGLPPAGIPTHVAPELASPATPAQQPPEGRELRAGLRALEHESDTHSKAEDWAAYVDSQVRLAESPEAVPEHRRRALTNAARVAAAHLGDESRAVELVGRAWETDPSTVSPLLDAAEFCETSVGVLALASLHETVLGELSQEDDIVSLALSCSRLLQHRLRDPKRAGHAISAAIRLAPNAAALRVELSRIYSLLGARDLGEEQARTALLLDPILPDAYAALSMAVREAHGTDLTWRAASVAVGLGTTDAAAITLSQELSPSGLTTPSRALNVNDWARLRCLSNAPEHTDHLGRCLQLVEPAVRMAYVRAQGPKPEWMDAAQEIDRAASTATVARSVGWASRFMGTDAPRLWVTDEMAHAGRLELAPEPSLVVSRSLTSGLSLPEFAFLSARLLTYAQTEWTLLGLLGSPERTFDWLELCFAAASGPPLPTNALANRKIVGVLQAQLSNEARNGLLDLRQQATDDQLLRGLVALSVHAARVAGRVGLLVCGTPAVALGLCRKLPLEHMSPTEQLTDLSEFAISPELGELRLSLGIACFPAQGASASHPVPAPSL